MSRILKYFAPSSSPKFYHFSKVNSGSQIFSPFPPVAKSSMWRGRVWMTRMWGGSSKRCSRSHRTGSSSSPSCHPMFFLTHSLESKKRPNSWFLYISLLWKLISTSNSISWLYHISSMVAGYKCYLTEVQGYLPEWPSGPLHAEKIFVTPVTGSSSVIFLPVV